MSLLGCSPRERFYWGYVWDGTGNRTTAPIRNINNKSHMLEDQVCDVLDECGCSLPAHVLTNPCILVNSGFSY